MPVCAISRDSLLTLEAYARIRAETRPQAIAHRRLRSVALGDSLWLQFEDEQTVRRQIQEMLRLGKIFDERGIQAEIDAVAALVPGGSDWRATLLIAVPDGGADRRRRLERLDGVAGRIHVEIGGVPGTVTAQVDTDLEAPARGVVVHFLRFDLEPSQRAAARSGASIRVVCDHPQAAASALLSPAAAASLAADLR